MRKTERAATGGRWWKIKDQRITKEQGSHETLYLQEEAVGAVAQAVVLVWGVDLATGKERYEIIISTKNFSIKMINRHAKFEFKAFRPDCIE